MSDVREGEKIIEQNRFRNCEICGTDNSKANQTSDIKK